jgi:Nuclease-related domain
VQVTTNQGFVKSRRLIGRVATIFGFLCLIVGLVLTWVRQDLVFISYLTLLPGYILISYGGYNTVRWGTNPRIDEALAQSLKTLDHRYQLFNYVDGLPADNILLTPSSLVVFEVRPYMGEFRNAKDKWRRKLSALGVFMSITEGGLGNPSRDAKRKVDETKQFLAKRLDGEADGIPIEPVVVFTHPRATLVLDDPDVPVATAKELRAAIRTGDRRERIPGQLYRRLAKLLKNPEAG